MVIQFITLAKELVKQGTYTPTWYIIYELHSILCYIKSTNNIVEMTTILVSRCGAHERQIKKKEQDIANLRLLQKSILVAYLSLVRTTTTP